MADQLASCSFCHHLPPALVADIIEERLLGGLGLGHDRAEPECGGKGLVDDGPLGACQQLAAQGGGSGDGVEPDLRSQSFDHPRDFDCVSNDFRERHGTGIDGIFRLDRILTDFDRSQRQAAQAVTKFRKPRPDLFFPARVRDRPVVGMPETGSQQDRQAGEVGASEAVTKISGGDQRVAGQDADAKTECIVILARFPRSIFGRGGFDLRDFETQVGVATVLEAFRSLADQTRPPCV